MDEGGDGGVKPYYQDDYATIYHGDCREILPTLPKVDLVLTDPPYGVALGSRENNNREREAYASTDDSPEEIIKLVRFVLAVSQVKAGRVVLTPGVRNMFAYTQPSHIGAFYYPAASGCNVWGFSCWQPIFYYGPDPYAGKGSKPDSFQSTEPSEKNGHPCPKPIGQWSKLLERVSLQSDTILDPFMGSGTTLVAAKQLGRKAIGIEIEEKYCEIAARRLQQEYLPLVVTPEPALEEQTLL